MLIYCRVLSVTSDGRVAEWKRSKQDWAPPKCVDGLTGITVTFIAARENGRGEKCRCMPLKSNY